MEQTDTTSRRAAHCYFTGASVACRRDRTAASAPEGGALEALLRARGASLLSRTSVPPECHSAKSFRFDDTGAPGTSEFVDNASISLTIAKRRKKNGNMSVFRAQGQFKIMKKSNQKKQRWLFQKHTERDSCV